VVLTSGGVEPRRGGWITSTDGALYTRVISRAGDDGGDVDGECRPFDSVEVQAISGIEEPVKGDIEDVVGEEEEDEWGRGDARGDARGEGREFKVAAFFSNEGEGGVIGSAGGGVLVAFPDFRCFFFLCFLELFCLSIATSLIWTLVVSS